MKTKIITITLLVLMTLAAALTPFASVQGQNSLGVQVITIVPASQANIYTQTQSVYNGTVGALYNVKGTIFLNNSTYNVLMGNDIVASGTSDGYYVNTNFTIPELPGGDYTFAIEDIKEGNLNSTGNSPIQFLIMPSYNIIAASSYSQEGNTVGLTAQVTGGVGKGSYTANVTVMLPSPLNGNFSAIVPMTSNSLGTATGQVDFPSSSFQAGDSLNLGGLSPTDFSGNYTCYFNMTQGLGTDQFTVGFLDAASYHRGQTATVAAKGYSAGQTATLSVTSTVTGASIASVPLTADSNGVMSGSFQVPKTAPVGSCTATISTTSGSSKLMADTQIFLIPGYAVTVTTLNLAGQSVPSIYVLVQDQNANTSYNATSNSNGQANFQLENGPYLLTATWKGVNVGQTNITVNGAGSFTFTCKLTDLQILVKNENGTALPFVNLQIGCRYGSSASQALNVSAQTDSLGTYTLNSTLSAETYTIEASMYGQTFNAGNDTVSSLPAQAVYQVTIICPTEATTFSVVGYSGAAISGAQVQLVELTNGLFYSASTDSSGSAAVPLTFGTYKLQIYQQGILINQTTVKAFAPAQITIRCTLYGIQVSVQVVDYFGSPISNANVTVNGPATERYSAMTHGDGKTTFSDVIGGNLQIVAFAGDKSNYQAISMNIDQPTTVQIKMGGYVAFGSLLVPTTALLTIILIIVAVVALVVVEMFLRRRRATSEA